ncbi:MAG: multiheme c-type cytochrome [Fibrobacterota bacterium]
MKAMRFLHYDAVHVASNEMKLGLDFLQSVNKEAALPLLSTNLVYLNGKPVFKDVVHVKYRDFDVSVVGLSGRIDFSAPDAARLRLLPPENALAEALKKIKKGPRTLVVLLTNLEEGPLKKTLEKNPGIDLVINADNPQYREAPTAFGTVQIVSDIRQTKNISGLSFAFKDGKIADATGFRTPLEPKYDKNKDVDSVVEAYNKVLATAKLSWPRPRDAQHLYAGSTTCAACHARESENWKSSLHPNAFEVLEKGGNAYNPACLECHVTGYERENGFWDIESSRDMAGVQCEACHGSLQNHVDEESKRTFSQPGLGGTAAEPRRQYRPGKAGYYLCQRCHVDKYKLPVSPEESWKKIGHGAQ